MRQIFRNTSFKNLLFLLLFLAPWLIWLMLPLKGLNVLIIDKTVPDISLREHHGLVWILNNLKYVKKEDLSFYDAKKDYIGFFPLPDHKYSIKNMPSNLNQYDVIYITDAYGVYKDDFFKQNLHGNRSEIIYGGIKKSEVDSIRKALQYGKTLVAEFNTFATPTDEKTRQELSEILGVKWQHWIGRFFSDLTKTSEIPAWVITDYERQTHQKWNFVGPGLVFINAQDEVVVLPGYDKKNTACRLVFTEEGKKYFGLQKNTHYDYWFDIVAAPDAKTFANFELHLKEKDRKLLHEKGIPIVFPAITKSNNPNYHAYYLAGDFCDVKLMPLTSKLWGLDKLRSWFSLGEEDFFWQVYVPVMKEILAEKYFKTLNRAYKPLVYKEKNVFLAAKTKGKNMQVYTENGWQDIFIKGVNLGTALPGKWFTEFPEREEDYLRWFQQIGEMHANTVRVYTLMPPEFYGALKKYNISHADKKLWLIQEVWPDEKPYGDNYLHQENQVKFIKEIHYAVDALHGNAEIMKRSGRAYGSYYADVSENVLAFLVGRELEPDEVIATDKLNKGFIYKGSYLSGDAASSPTENWLAWSSDELVKYEENKYRWQHPVGIVSWPTLDAITHDSEWNTQGNKMLEYNDKAVIDIRHLSAGPKLLAGFFAAYHIYPNYPDFINNEPSYNAYHDEEGRFRYGGYLQELQKSQGDYPVLVAEFGLATGMGNAHSSPDGYNHGGLSETAQGKGIVRMLKAIKREGYTGGMVFEWMDEWAKKTWITEPFMIPYERHVLWHNAIDPEQNYGIMAMESIEPSKPILDMENPASAHPIKKIALKHDETYFYIDVTLADKNLLQNKELYIGLDTYDRTRGEYKYAENINIQAPSGMEFMLHFKNGTGQILVIPAYNISKNKYASKKSTEGFFEEISPVINKARITKDGTKISEKRENASKLTCGDFSESHNHWFIEGNILRVRIPWGRINFSDPSSMTVIDDTLPRKENPLRDELKTVKSDGIIVSALLFDGKYAQGEIFYGKDQKQKPLVYRWNTWNMPKYHERLKKSYDIIKKAFENF